MSAGSWRDWFGFELIPRCCVQAKTSGAAGDDADFAFEREDAGEVVELGFGHGGGWKCNWMPVY